MQKVKQKDIMLIVLALAVAIIPLVVKVAVVERSSVEIGVLGYEQYYVDTFSFYKSRLIVFFGVLISLIFLNDVVNKVVRGRPLDFKGFIKKPVNAFMCVYMLAVVLSTLFSPYKELALNGSHDRYEGVFVLISYCLIMFGVMYAVDTEKRAELLLYGVFFSATVIGAIGLMQFFGNDPFKNESFQNFLIGNAGARQNLTVRDYTIKYPTVFSTLYNPNSLGLYASMLFMITASLAALLPIKSVLKYIAAILTPIMLVIVVGSYSLAGIIGAFAGMFAFLVIYLIFMIAHRIKIKVEVIVAAAVVVASVAVFTQTTYFKSSLSNLAQKANWSLLASTDSKVFNHIKIIDNIVDVSTSRGDFFISYDIETNSVLLLDSEKNLIEPDEVIYDDENERTTSIYSFDSIRGLRIVHFSNVFMLNYVGLFRFGIYDDGVGTITAVSPAGNPFDINEPTRSIGFEDMQSIANSRGYIWSKSLPLMFDNVLIGKGPDTFVMQFPQNDVVGKTNFYRGDSTIVIDKPHNTYIQYAVNTGLVSLIALLAVFGMYLINTIKSVLKSEPHNVLTPMQIGVFSGISAYLVVNLSTDSVVSVAPVFWCVLGLGFAINNIKSNTNDFSKSENRLNKEVKNVKGTNNKRK